MAYIKCKYNEVYCDNKLCLMNEKALYCDTDLCNELDNTEFDYEYILPDEKIPMCNYGYSDSITFEKNVKEYEYNHAENILRIGKDKYYKYIEYLEIDGEVLKEYKSDIDNIPTSEQVLDEISEEIKGFSKYYLETEKVLEIIDKYRSVGDEADWRSNDNRGNARN